MTFLQSLIFYGNMLGCKNMNFSSVDQSWPTITVMMFESDEEGSTCLVITYY